MYIKRPKEEIEE